MDESALESPSGFEVRRPLDWESSALTSRSLWFKQVAPESLKALYLHYHNVYGHQAWRGDDFHKGIPGVT